MNLVVVEGNLTRDCELKYVGGGTACGTFSIANNVYAGKDKDDYVSYFECVMWAKRAEALAPYLVKGTGVVVQGELRQERWEKDGEKRSAMKITVNAISLKGRREKSSDAPSENRVEIRDADDFQDDIPF
jgi:single-strand DNA-binding protein